MDAFGIRLRQEVAATRAAWILRVASQYWRVPPEAAYGDEVGARRARAVVLLLLGREGCSAGEATAALGLPPSAARQAQRAVQGDEHLARAVETIGWTIPVLSQVSRRWDLDQGAVWGRCRQTPLPDARHVAMYLINAAGPNLMEIARTFDRNHSSVVHAIRRVRATTVLSREAEALRWVIRRPYVPQQALVQALAQALDGALLSSTERGAIRAYICGMLTHLEPFQTAMALAGLRLLAHRGALVWAVREALAQCDLEGYLPHIRLHARQLDPAAGAVLGWAPRRMTKQSRVRSWRRTRRRTSMGGVSMERSEQETWDQKVEHARLVRRQRRREQARRLALRAGVGGAGLLALLLATTLARQPLRQAGAGVPGHAGRHLAQVSSAARHTARFHTGSAGTALAPADAVLTLDPPPAAGAGSGATALRVTLSTPEGAPLPGLVINLVIDGPAPFQASTHTDPAGQAAFSYTGAQAGPYTIHVTALAGTRPLAATSLQVPVRRAPVVSTDPVQGRFYASDDRCTFDTPAEARPVLRARFPTLNFSGRPFLAFSAGAMGAARPVGAAGLRVGDGALRHFNAVFTGHFHVARAGTVSFTVLIDDAFDLGIGGGATRVSGSMSNPPRSGTTATRRLPILGAFNQGHLQATTHVTVHFPHPGIYAYELDYAECKLGGEAVRVSTGGQFLPTYTGPARP
jgi:hypothetical protein